MTLVVRGSGRSWAPSSKSVGVARLRSRRYVVRALLTATTCSHVVKRPRPPQVSILVATLSIASWHASSASPE